MYFIQLLALKFGGDALVRLQRVLIYITNTGPPVSHQNLLLARFRFLTCFRCFVMIMPLSRPFTIVIKDPLFITSQYSFKKWNHSNFVDTAFETSKPRILWYSQSSCETHLSTFFNLPIFLRTSEILEMLASIHTLTWL